MQVRPYQAEAFIQALTHPGWRHGYVCWDTGAGKSVFARMLVTYWMAHQSRITHGLIMSPYTTTRAGFVKDSEFDRVFDFSEAREELAPELVSALDELVPDGQLVMPEGLIREGTKQDLADYFADPNPGHIKSICLQSGMMFGRFRGGEDWPLDMSRMAVVFDEYQWKGAKCVNAMAQVIESRKGIDRSEVDLDTDAETANITNIRGVEPALQDFGCLTLNLSATPWRSDGVPTQHSDLSDPCLFTTFRTLPEQIADEYAPRVTFTITPFEVRGDTLEERIDNMAADVAELPRHRPGCKAVVRIKPRDGRDCDGLTLANRIRTRLGEHWGDRGRDATDYHPDNPEMFRAFLDRERARTDFNDSEADFIFGVNVPIVGMDWVFANLGIAIGLIRSTASIVQFVGRFTRSKDRIQNYPPQCRNEVEVQFLVPLVRGEPLANFIENQSENLARMMLRVSLILSQVTMPDSFKAFNAVRDTLFRALGATRDHVGHRQVRANIRARILRDLIWLCQEGMLLGEYREILLRRFAGSSDVEEQDINEALLQAWAAQANEDELARMRSILNADHNLTRTREAFDPGAEAFKILVEEFREEAIHFRASPLIPDVVELFTQLDNVLPGHFARRFEGTRSQLHVDHIVRCWLAYWERHQQYPVSGPVEGAPEWTWETLQEAVRNGSPSCGVSQPYPDIQALVLERMGVTDLEVIQEFNALYDDDGVRCVETVEFSDPSRWRLAPAVTAQTQRWLYRRYIRARTTMPRHLDGARVMRQVTLQVGVWKFLRHFKSNQNNTWVEGRLRYWEDLAQIAETSAVTDQMIRNLIQNRPLVPEEDAAE